MPDIFARRSVVSFWWNLYLKPLPHVTLPGSQKAGFIGADLEPLEGEITTTVAVEVSYEYATVPVDLEAVRKAVQNATQR